MNRKPLIGILATSDYMLTNDTFKDMYKYGNNFIKRIYDNGGIPFLIPYMDDKVIYESLEMCDGLLLPGGNRVLESNFKVIDYFYKNDKPILGICLGMQTLGMYSMKIDGNDKRIMADIPDNIHWPHELLRDNNTELAHELRIDNDSLLYDILKKNNVMVNSVHRHKIMEVGNDFKVIAYANDNTIEGIQSKSKKFVLGLQFHPEVLDEFNDIFKVFIDKCK